MPNGNASKDETIDEVLSRIVKEQCNFKVKRNKVIFQSGMEEYYILVEEYDEQSNNWLALVINRIKRFRNRRYPYVWKSFHEVKSNIISIYPEQDRDKIRLFIERQTMTDKLMALSDYDLLKKEGFITAPLDELGFNNYPATAAAKMNEVLRRSMEMQRRLKDEIKKFNESTRRSSIILICLTVIMTIAVLVQIYLMLTKGHD